MVDASHSNHDFAQGRDSPSVQRGFPPLFDVLSEDNRRVGCDKVPTLRKAIENRQQPLEKDLRGLPPDHHAVHPHQIYVVDVPSIGDRNIRWRSATPAEHDAA